MKQPITIRLDPELLANARICAKEENRTLTNFLETVLKERFKASGGREHRERLDGRRTGRKRLLKSCAIPPSSQVIWATMGVGAALMEELAVDKRRGFFVNHDLAGYEVPVHADIPHQEILLRALRGPKRTTCRSGFRTTRDLIPSRQPSRALWLPWGTDRATRRRDSRRASKHARWTAPARQSAFHAHRPAQSDSGPKALVGKPMPANVAADFTATTRELKFSVGTYSVREKHTSPLPGVDD
jgi:hypothetical protein